ETEGEFPLCYGCVQFSQDDGQVQCVSRKIPIQIRTQPLKGSELKQAIEVFPRDRHSTDQDVCASCLYKVLNDSYEGEDGNLSLSS
ncbi:MAG: hypothetical protein P1Q69_19210, partial [Candidatus Thorarchaeota archaeon]|nr:hypothetical protein [Candidatus Thorarchaeota archaeon]